MKMRFYSSCLFLYKRKTPILDKEKWASIFASLPRIVSLIEVYHIARSGASWSIYQYRLIIGGMTIAKIRLQFARKLKQKRQEAKLTQEKVAELIGVSARYYQMLESKKPTAVKIDTIEKLAKALKTPAWKLFQFKD